ncbi:MAG: two-component response regulator [Acidimicrobiales bacterium]|nr:two-component response regulator [Acidimicrobiales bacterium]
MGAKRETGVLIVDDEEDMRALLRSTIEIANEGLRVAGEAVDGEDAVIQWREKRPQIIVLDQRMPGATGLEVAERILAEHPEQTIILFSAYLDPDILDRAAELGIRACMSKREISRVPEALWKYAPGS